MSRVTKRLRTWLRSGGGRSVAKLWPLSTVLRRLDCNHEKEAADALLSDLAALDKKTRADKYAQATATFLNKHQRAVSSLTSEVTSAIGQLT